MSGAGSIHISGFKPKQKRSLFSELMSFPSEVDFYLFDYVRSDHDEPGVSRKLLPQRRRRKHSRAWSIFQQFYNPNQAEEIDDLLENDLMISKSAIAVDTTISTTNADTSTALNVTDEIGAMKETVNEQQLQSAPSADEAAEKSPPSDVDSQPATEETTTVIVTNEADETSNRKLMSSHHLRHKRHHSTWSVLQNLFNPQWEIDEESESSKKKESSEIEFLQVGTESSDTGTSPSPTTSVAATEDRPIEFLSLSDADIESSIATNVTIIASLNGTISAVNKTLSTINSNGTTIPTWNNITTVALNSTTVVDNSNSTFIGTLGNSTLTWSNSTLTVVATNVTSIDTTDKSNSTTVVILGNNSTSPSSSNSTLISLANTTSINLNSNTTGTTIAAANSTTVIITGGNNSTMIVAPSSMNATDVTVAARNNNTATTNSSDGNAATSFPSSRPSLAPTSWPSSLPSSSPSSMPSSWPTFKPSGSIFEPSSRPSAAPSLRAVIINDSGVINTSFSKSAIAGICFALLFALAGCYVVFSQYYDANNRLRKGAKRLEDESPGPLPPDTVRSFNELYASDDEEEGHNDSVPLANRYGASGGSYKQRVRVPPPLAISSVGYNY